MKTLNFKDIQGQKISYTINKGDKIYSRNMNSESNSFTHRSETYQFDKQTKTITQVIDMATVAKPLQPLQSEFHINARFGFLESFSEMVLSNITASLLVTGEGGLGKSHTVMEAIAKKGFVEGEDYVVVKGYATPKALYATLYENRHSLIVFDDTDSVLKDPTALNILKGALDSYDKRTISWLSKGFIDDGLPSSFDFEGQIIFISNLSLEKIDGAVKSRTMAVDLSMSVQDKIDRMRTILPNILTDVSMSVRTDALNFVEDHKDEATELNMRTLQKVIKVAAFSKAQGLDWEDAAKYLLTNA